MSNVAIGHILFAIEYQYRFLTAEKAFEILNVAENYQF